MVEETIAEGFKQTEIGVIPRDWEAKPIGGEIDLLTGFPFPSSKYASNGVKLLRGSNIKRGKTDWAEEITEFWEKVTFDLQPYVLKVGDIVVAMDGSLVGRSFARLSQRDLPALLLQRVARIRSDKIDMGYLKEYICSDYFTKYCDSVKTITAIPHISPLDIKKFVIPLPPTKKEQSAIAQILSDTDALIESLDKLIEKKKNIKRGAMQELLTGKKRLPGFYDEWQTVPLKSIISQFIVPMRDKPKIFRGDIPWCRIEDFNGRYLSDSKSEQYVDDEIIAEMNLKVCPKNTLLVSCSADLGRCAIVKKPLVTNQTFIGLVINNVKASEEFLYYYMTHHAEELNNLSSGTTISYLSREQFEAYKVNIPSLKEEQKAIAQVLSDMDTDIEALVKKREKYRQLKVGMMQQLLTGRIRLKCEN